MVLLVSHKISHLKQILNQKLTWIIFNLFYFFQLLALFHFFRFIMNIFLIHFLRAIFTHFSLLAYIIFVRDFIFYLFFDFHQNTLLEYLVYNNTIIQNVWYIIWEYELILLLYFFSFMCLLACYNNNSWYYVGRVLYIVQSCLPVWFFILLFYWLWPDCIMCPWVLVYSYLPP